MDGATNPRNTGQKSPATAIPSNELVTSLRSPTYQAWQRFRTNRGAVWSMRLLALISILAVLTPFLPLQSPRLALTERSLSSPVLSPLVVDQNSMIAAMRGNEAIVPNVTTEAPRQTNVRDLEYGFRAEEIDWFDGLLFRARNRVFGSWRLNSLCGRDLLGRDLLSRIFWGARISLAVGFVAALVSLLLGVIYGGVAGFAGGWVDSAMMRLVDILQSVPFIFVVIFLVTVLDARGGFLEHWGLDRVTLFFFVVGSVFWLTMARVVRGQVKSLRQEPFVEAARATGAGRARILFRHILPHTRGIVLAYLTLTVPRVMLFEAFLSFLGLGISPPDVSWGLLMQEGVGVLTPIRIDWWLIVFPGLTLAATLYMLNVLGDGLRDALDPKARS
ncbi:MAG: ABC transporter permease [Pirellulales bacterium]|nr:ABC transporter permease [Pirellulales bacterium]